MSDFSKAAQIARSPKTQKQKKKGKPQMMVNEYMAYIKHKPCFISGSSDIEVCHMPFISRQGVEHYPRSSRALERSGTSHLGVCGVCCLPLTRELHAEQHKIGYEKFFEKYNISLAEVYSYMAKNLAEFFIEYKSNIEP